MDGHAVHFDATVGTPLTATIRNTGAIKADGDAIDLDAEADETSGSVTITNRASISSANGHAIDFGGAGKDFVTTIINAGDFLAAEDHAIRVGGQVRHPQSWPYNGGASDGSVTWLTVFTLRRVLSVSFPNNETLVLVDGNTAYVGGSSQATTMGFHLETLASDS